jgi:hypothetical protein
MYSAYKCILSTVDVNLNQVGSFPLFLGPLLVSTGIVACTARDKHTAFRPNDSMITTYYLFNSELRVGQKYITDYMNASIAYASKRQ